MSGSVIISPPVPAPYLDGIGSLPDELLPQLIRKKELLPEEHAKVQSMIYGELAPRIRERRRMYEQMQCVTIERELPPGLFE